MLTARRVAIFAAALEEADAHCPSDNQLMEGPCLELKWRQPNQHGCSSVLHSLSDHKAAPGWSLTNRPTRELLPAVTNLLRTLMWGSRDIQTSHAGRKGSVRRKEQLHLSQTKGCKAQWCHSHTECKNRASRVNSSTREAAFTDRH